MMGGKPLKHKTNMPKAKSYYALEIFTIPLNMGKTYVFVLESRQALQEVLALVLKVENQKDVQEVLYTINNRRNIMVRIIQNGKMSQEINLLPYITYEFSGKKQINPENTDWIDALFLTLQETKGIIDEPVKVIFLPAYNPYNIWEINTHIDWENMPIPILQEPIIQAGQKVKYTSVCTKETWYYQLMGYDEKTN